MKKWSICIFLQFIIVSKTAWHPEKSCNKQFLKNGFKSVFRYIFLEYADPKSALAAVKSTNNYKIDKQHTFKLNLFTDFTKYEQIPEDWKPEEPQEYKAAGDLHHYLLDPDAYDQFCILSGNGSNVSVQVWQNSAPEPTLLEERSVN